MKPWVSKGGFYCFIALAVTILLCPTVGANEIQKLKQKVHPKIESVLTELQEEYEKVRSGDVSILGLRVYDGDVARTTSLSLSSRFPLWGGLRAGPRLRFDYRQFSADNTTQWLASPAVRIDWHSDRTTIEFEAGGEWMSRELVIDQEKTSRYWFSLGYRVGF